MFQPVRVIETGQYGVCEVNEVGVASAPMFLCKDPQETMRACQNAARSFTTRGIAKYSAESKSIVRETPPAPPVPKEEPDAPVPPKGTTVPGPETPDPDEDPDPLIEDSETPDPDDPDEDPEEDEGHE